MNRFLAIAIQRVLPAVVGLVFVVASVAKLLDSSDFERVLSRLGLTHPGVAWISLVIPPIEIALGISLIALWGGRRVIAFALATLAVFTGVLLYLVIDEGAGAPCGCSTSPGFDFFGGTALSGVLRNFLLMLLLSPSLFRPHVSVRVPQGALRCTSGRHIISLALAVVASQILVERAHAQWIGTMFDPRTPFLTPREAEAIGDRLMLNSEQRVILESLLATDREAMDRFLARWDEFRRAEARPDGDLTVPDAEERLRLAARGRAIMELVDNEAARREELRLSVQAILTIEQADSWNDFLRDRRRLRATTGDSHYAEERVDLVRLVSELDMDTSANPELTATLKVYEIVLDDLLVRREKLLHEYHRQAYMERIASNEGSKKQAHEFDPDVARGMTPAQVQEYARSLGERRRRDSIDAVRPLMNVRLRIRDAQRLYLDRIAAHLDDDQTDQLRRSFNRSAYPAIYRPAGRSWNADVYYGNVVELESLTDDQRAVIESLWAQHRVAFDAVSSQLARLQTREEQDWERRLLEGSDSEVTAQRDKLLRDRRELQERTVLGIRSILTHDQQRLVPDFLLRDDGW